MELTLPAQPLCWRARLGLLGLKERKTACSEKHSRLAGWLGPCAEELVPDWDNENTDEGMANL